MYKERKKKKALNRSLRAYNIRLPQLQLMMATHAQLCQFIPEKTRGVRTISVN